MAKGNIVTRVRDGIEEAVTSLGFDIWDVTFYKDGADFTLEVAINKPDGAVSLEDCSTVTRAIDPIIDAINPVEEAYCLMVSSAGSERDLRSTYHIAYALHKKAAVTIKLFAPLDGNKQFSGILTNMDEETLTMTTDEGNEITLTRKQFAKISAVFENTVEL